MLPLGSTLLVWISVAGFRIALGTKYFGSSIPLSPCLPGQPCSPGKPFYLPKPRYRRPSFPVKFSYKRRTSNDPCINSFVCTFVEKVRSCPELTALFNFFHQTSAEEFCYRTYPKILETVTATGTQNPEFVSEKAVESIVDCFDFLSSDIVIQVYVKTIAKFLYTQGILTPQNSVELATQYADTMEESARCNVSQYTALHEGFVNFLGSFGLIGPDNILFLALLYANEWKMAAKPKYG